MVLKFIISVGYVTAFNTYMYTHIYEEGTLNIFYFLIKNILFHL